jgi:hypothetical protein
VATSKGFVTIADVLFGAIPLQRKKIMSDRERWIVYPLLFLTLGVALRNQFLPTKRFGAVDLKAGELTAQVIRCNTLEVGRLRVREEGTFQKNLIFQRAEGKFLRTGRAESHIAACSTWYVVDEKGKNLIVAGKNSHTRSGFLQTFSSQGIPLVLISANASGGAVSALGNHGKTLVALGHEGRNFGVYGQFPQLGPPFLLTPRVRLHVEPLPTPSAKPSGEKKEAQEKAEPSVK